jgi:ATP-dependent Clp protease ATP-binding subunit ClpB
MKFSLNRVFKQPNYKPLTIKLDESKVPDEVQKLEEYLRSKVIGQDRAIKQFVRAYEVFLSEMKHPDRPLGVLLFLGPTGVGKTRVVEVFAEYLWKSKDALIKLNCAEFQAAHEISKLIGAPPGYVGHKETKDNDDKQIFTKTRIEKYWNQGPKFTPILLDEIEKAHSAFHKLLLGIFDRGELTTGHNEKIDFRNTLIVMTSNLGARDVSSFLGNRQYGFQTTNSKSSDQVDQEIYKISKEAVKSFFDPEIVNRIDRTVVFRPLSNDDLGKILAIELDLIQDRIIAAKKFIILDVSQRAKNFLLSEGTSKEYGARELSRTIERFVISKITRAFSTKQAVNGDMVLVDVEPEAKEVSLEIMKGVIDFPDSWVRPEAPGPFESSYKPGRCGRCGAVWQPTHQCQSGVTSSEFWSRYVSTNKNNEPGKS